MNRSHYIKVNGVNVLVGEKFCILGLTFRLVELKEGMVTYSGLINGIGITLAFEYYHCFDTDYYKVSINGWGTLKLFEPNTDMTEFLSDQLCQHIVSEIYSCESEIKCLTPRLEAFRDFKKNNSFYFEKS